MNEAIDNTTPTVKLYKDRAFWVGTFLGGPLVAGYLFSENFKSLGESEKVKPTWIITIIAKILILSGVFLIPDNIDIPKQIIPIAYTTIAFGLFKKYQEEKTLEHINQGGLIYNWGRVIEIGIIGLLITTLSIFAIVYTSDTINQVNISTKTYGVAAKHEIDFDKSNVSEKEIDKIADGFRETGFFDLSVAKYVYVVKNGDKYEISISIIQGMENNTRAIQPFVDLRTDMDNYFPKHKIEFKLVTDNLENVVKILK